MLQAFLILTFFLLTQFFTGFEFRLTFGFDLFQLGLAVAFKLFFSFGFCFQQRFFFSLLLLQKFLVFFCLPFLQFFFGFLLSFKSFTSFFLTGFSFIGFALAEFFDLFQREFLRLLYRSDNSGNGVRWCRNNRIFCSRLYWNGIYIRRKERFCFTDSRRVDRQKFNRNRIFYSRRYNNFFYSLLLALLFRADGLLNRFRLFFPDFRGQCFFRNIFRILCFNLFGFYLFLFDPLGSHAGFPAGGQFRSVFTEVFLEEFNIFLKRLSPHQGFIVVVGDRKNSHIFVQCSCIAIRSVDHLIIMQDFIQIKEAMNRQHAHRTGFFKTQIKLLHHKIGKVIGGNGKKQLVTIECSGREH